MSTCVWENGLTITTRDTASDTWGFFVLQWIIIHVIWATVHKRLVLRRYRCYFDNSLETVNLMGNALIDLLGSWNFRLGCNAVYEAWQQKFDGDIQNYAQSKISHTNTLIYPESKISQTQMQTYPKSYFCRCRRYGVHEKPISWTQKMTP